jgi:hypothetical protein
MNKVKTNKLKLKNKKLHSEFVKEMKKKIPCISIGLISNKDNSPKYLEVIVKRPERYSFPNIMKAIPKTYKGVKVKAF